MSEDVAAASTRGEPAGGQALGLDDLAGLVEWMDTHLDGAVAERYKDQPLAQHWARVAKAGEEVGEAIDALIGVTGQNPRKGFYGSEDHLLDELADTALTGIYAMQHFTKDAPHTIEKLLARAAHHRERVENPPPKSGAAQIAAERDRQVDAEGWTPEHDDEHDSGELTLAARCYLFCVQNPPTTSPPVNWPWGESWWKPSEDPIRNLVKAGALIAAEIDRLQRAAPAARQEHP